jgi:gliding motility-associated-like protein
VAQRTFVISQNTVTPVSSISPSLQNITCSVTTVITVTANATPTVNITQNIISPQSVTFTSNAHNIIYVPGGSGTYTHVVTNNINGCSTVGYFTVTSNQGYPTFSLTSPQNFTLGCGTKSVAGIAIVGGNTTPPGGAVSYTLLSPSASSVTPAGPLGTNSNFSVNVPGTWTVITKDNVSLCETRVAVSVLSNTFGPSLDTLIVPRKVLDCFVPGTRLKAISTNTNVSYSWAFPTNPGNQAGDTLQVSAHFSSRTATLVDNYTLTITDNNNTCITKTVVPIYQNLFIPKAVISNGGVDALTCNTATIMLSNMSSTGIQGSVFPSNGQVIGQLWEGPTPQEPLQVSSNYLASQVGTYTMTAMDLNNGCTSQTTIVIADNRLYPVVNKPIAPPPFILDCGAAAATLSLIITSDLQPLVYEWIPPLSATTSVAGNGKLSTNTPGQYKVVVTNTLNGCASSGEAIVENGTLEAGFIFDTGSGYAPLPVSFTNTSASSNTTTATNSITSVWNFGNGTTSLTSTSQASVSSVYNLPGDYTVTLFSAKGSCIDSVYKTIHVDFTSDIMVPNVFTPNDDGVNDIYFLKTTNITMVTVVIFDRWGHKVYELTSNTGNIAWDGKNQQGAKVSEGTYYYILKGEGIDGKAYNKKGTISLYR